MKKECDTLSVKMKSLLLALIAVTVTILFCLSAASAIKAHAAETLDAWDITDQMTIG